MRWQGHRAMPPRKQFLLQLVNSTGRVQAVDVIGPHALSKERDQMSLCRAVYE